jgi:hypothetical protein
MPIVYIHMKPKSREIFYVGIGNSIGRAFRNEGRNSHWTRVFNKYGKVVDIICQDVSLNEAKEMEKFLIASIGVENLCNKTLGGEGAFGLKHSEETRKKISEKTKGRKLSAETIAKIVAKTKGHPNYNLSHTDEAKAKISAAFKGKKRSEYFCKRVKEGKVGYKVSQNAHDASIKVRKEKAALIKELTTGFVGKIWEIQERFNIPKQSVYYNYKHDKPISKLTWEGLNFIKL